METRENLSLPENEEHDTKKYTKHINDLIEDAEIEAEIEAETEAKKIEEETEGKKIETEENNDLFISYRLDFHTRDELNKFKKKYNSLIL